MERQLLSWIDDLGPGYSKKKAEDFLKNRYSNSLIPIRYTLKRLLKNAEFESTLKRLCQDCWFDWHLLVAIRNVAVTYCTR